MLHKFLEDGDWFAPKRYGYGAGLPIAWQGWALLLIFCVAITGFAVMLPSLHGAKLALVMADMLVLTSLFLMIVAKRTRGGWRWRSGERD